MLKYLHKNWHRMSTNTWSFYVDPQYPQIIVETDINDMSVKIKDFREGHSSYTFRLPTDFSCNIRAMRNFVKEILPVVHLSLKHEVI